ncbi:hypothetical protein [Burkholderia cenocepacia]|uniref:hypothetical protein n=1 Tax=Burkholderia cenocepacia TaxID=95486 RepID=UPI001F4A6E16|nr:hypothetical protein [Burkholderia cenocepacia]
MTTEAHTMTTQNEKSPLTRNASGQENGTEIEARGLSSAVNGTQTENLTSRKSPAPEQASEATAARPSMEDSTAEGIVDARTAGGNETSSKVCRADALTADEREVLEHTAGFLHATAATALRKLLAASPIEQPAAAPIELSGVKETLETGDGFWRSCSGCHETCDGHPVGEYPYSAILKCDLGAGCSECGGIGAVWDNTDYTAMGGAFERAGLLNGCDAPTPADERAAWDDTRHSLAVAMCGFASRAGNRDLDAAISVIDAITEAGSPLSWLRTARASSANETGAEGVRAWETDDGRVISDAQKQQALRDGGASASSVQPFHIALGKISAAQAAEPVPRKAGYVLVPVEPTQAMLDRGYWPCTQGRGAKSVWGEMLRAIPAAPQPPAQADARIDVEAMLRACVPGGDICDPQRIADSIREWFDDHGAQADAREGLTDEQRDVLGGNFGALEQAEDLCRATGNDSSADGLNALSYVLRALLATRQPEPRAEVTGNGGAK